MPRERSRRNQGFSLLEVMVAIGILGLAASVVLSAQGNLISHNRRASNMGTAIHLGRCKMSEIEEKLLKLGFSEIDELESSNSCCDDKDTPSFSCDWRIEKVLLPLPPQDTLTADGGGILGLPEAGVPPGLPGLTGNPAAPLDLDAGLAGLGQGVGQQALGGAGGAGGGALGLLKTVFGIVYPSLKPLLETSIRRVTVTMKWKEGINSQELALVQYIVNPQRAGLLGGVNIDGGALSDGGPVPVPTTTGTGTAPTPPGGTKF